jgi:hypothetical protein
MVPAGYMAKKIVKKPDWLKENPDLTGFWLFIR